MQAIEVVRFRLRDGVTTGDARVAVTESAAFLDRATGFVSRVIGQAEDGEWIDIVIWESMETALHAAEAFMNAPEAAALIGAIDMSSTAMAHYAVVSSTRA